MNAPMTTVADAVSRIAPPDSAAVADAVDRLGHDVLGVDLVRPVFQQAISNTIGLSGLTTGTAGGFMNMFDAGAFHGINGHSDFSFTMDNFSTFEYCMVQFGVGAFVSAAVNILLLGNFRNISYFVRNDGSSLGKAKFVKK